MIAPCGIEIRPKQIWKRFSVGYKADKVLAIDGEYVVFAGHRVHISRFNNKHNGYRIVKEAELISLD